MQHSMHPTSRRLSRLTLSEPVRPARLEKDPREMRREDQQWEALDYYYSFKDRGNLLPVNRVYRKMKVALASLEPDRRNSWRSSAEGGFTEMAHAIMNPAKGQMLLWRTYKTLDERAMEFVERVITRCCEVLERYADEEDEEITIVEAKTVLDMMPGVLDEDLSRRRHSDLHSEAKYLGKMLQASISILDKSTAVAGKETALAHRLLYETDRGGFILGFLKDLLKAIPAGRRCDLPRLEMKDLRTQLEKIETRLERLRGYGNYGSHESHLQPVLTAIIARTLPAAERR